MKYAGRRILMRALAFALAIMCVSTSGALALTLYTTLEFGDSGSDVQKMQETLLALKFDPKGVDGRFGQGTEDAVKAFQKSVGLKADGKAERLP